jgi:hypothetical protein
MSTNGLLEEGRGLPRPHLAAGVVEHVEQRLDVFPGEAPAQIARGGGVGQAAGAQGIEQGLIVAEQLQVLQASAAAQGQVSQGQHVVRFVIGEVDFQDLQAAVDGLDQAQVADQSVHGPEAADGDATAAFRNLVVDVASGSHGLRAAAQVRSVQTAFDTALAVGQFPSYDRFHSKPLARGEVASLRCQKFLAAKIESP